MTADDKPSIAASARAHADEVEAELGADEESTEPTEPTEPEPTEPEASAGGPTDADLKRFESENTRHERALEKIIGADWSDFAPCDTCGGVGHVPTAQNKAFPFEHDPQAVACEVCNGYGTTLTGAKEPGMVTRPCSSCTGSGWKTVQEHPEVQPFVPTEPPTPAANGAPLEQPVASDPRVAALRAEGYIVLDRPETVPTPGS